MKIPIDQFIRQRIKDSGLTLDEFAFHIGISQSYFSMLLNRKKHFAKAGETVKENFCRLLNIDRRELEIAFINGKIDPSNITEYSGESILQSANTPRQVKYDRITKELLEAVVEESVTDPELFRELAQIASATTIPLTKKMYREAIRLYRLEHARD